MDGAGAASERYTAARNSSALRSLIVNALLLVLCLAVPAIAALIVVRSVVRPLRIMAAAIREIADGKLDVAIPGLGRQTRSARWRPRSTRSSATRASGSAWKRKRPRR